MAHLWTPQDLPADFKLGWYHFPDSATVTLDANGKIALIENKFDNGLRPCSTPSSAKRHLLQKTNGFDTAFSDATDYGGILMNSTTGLPVGNADLCMIFIQQPQDGVVGGYRGGNNYWIDNPFPDYRMRTDKGDFNGTGTTNNSSLHTLIINRKSGTSTMRVDGFARGSQTPSGGYNTTLGTFGIKGADAGYYVQKGASLGAIIGKRAATADEMYLIEKWYSTFTGQPVQADNPYINGLPMVADSSGSTGPTGAAAVTLAAVSAASAAALAIAGAATLALSPITTSSTGAALMAAQASGSLGPITGAAVGSLPVAAQSSPQLGSVAATGSGSLPIAGIPSASLGPISTTAAARVDINAAAAASLNPVTASGAGGSTQLSIAQAAVTLAPVAAAGAGALRLSGTAATSLGSIKAAGTGQMVARGQAAATSGDIATTSAASAPNAARAAAQLAPVAASAAAALPITAAAAAVLAPIMVTATGTGDPDRPGGPAVILPQHRFVVPARQRAFTIPARPRAFLIRKGICMSSISKYPAEDRQYQADWTPDLAGQTITGDPEPSSSDPTLIVDEISMDGAVMKYWLRGGTSGRPSTIRFVAATSGGEDLVFEQTVIVY